MAPARTRLTLGLLLLASSCGGLGNTERIERHGVVVAEHPLATRVGVDVLAAGGNAA